MWSTAQSRSQGDKEAHALVEVDLSPRANLSSRTRLSSRTNLPSSCQLMTESILLTSASIPDAKTVRVKGSSDQDSSGTASIQKPQAMLHALVPTPSKNIWWLLWGLRKDKAIFLNACIPKASTADCEEEESLLLSLQQYRQ